VTEGFSKKKKKKKQKKVRGGGIAQREYRGTGGEPRKGLFCTEQGGRG